MNKKYKPVIAVAVLVILVAILGIVTHVVMKYIPSSEKMDLNEYYGEMADGEIALVIGTEKLEERGLVDGDRVYLPLDVVNTYLNQRYYWDSANQQILYATPSELTGFCNCFRITEYTIQIQRNSLFTITLQFFFQWFTHALFGCP